MNPDYPFHREKIADGTAFGTIADDRFKSNLLTVNLVLPLTRENVTEHALLPLTLEQCWEEAPTNRDLAKQLNRLYGASVTSMTNRLGNMSILTFAVTAIDSDYALAGEDMLLEQAKLLLGLLLRPAMQDGVLDPENLDMQKRYLAESIRAEINDKRYYAVSKTVRAMLKDEPCGLPHYGYLEDIEKITPESATKAWREILDHARMEIIHVGRGDASAARELFTRTFSAMERHPLPMRDLPELKMPETVQEFSEEKDVVQSKLCIGLRTGINAYSEDLSALRMMNTILGGSSTSRLFLNVREKMNLCYYCSSSTDRLRGTMMIDLGLDADKAEEAKAAIFAEIEAMRRGEFTDEDMEIARLRLQSSYQASGDSAYALNSFYLVQMLLGIEETPEDQGEKLKTVTREQICEAARKIRPEVIFLLKGTGKGEDVCEEA